MQSKSILIVCDGLGDLPLDGKTPLQKANAPALNKLAKEGACGLLYSVGMGKIPGSDTSHLAILGYDPEKYYNGRGPFEALGIGVQLKQGDVAFRANFATVDERMNVLDRRAGRIKTEGKELGKLIDGLVIDGVQVVFIPSVEHRAALVLRGDGLSPRVSDTDPHGGPKVLESKPLDATPEARKTASVLNKLTRIAFEKLNGHPINAERKKKKLFPANIVLARGPGFFDKAPSIQERYGVNGLCVAGGALYKGVAKFVGMEIASVPGATGTTESDLQAKASAAVKGLEKHELVFVHVKGTDSASHDGNCKEKIRMIEKIDKMAAAILKRTGGKPVNIVVTGDHSTPCALKDHSWHPTPILMWGPAVRTDDVKKFNEIDCAHGGLGVMKGLDVMPVLLALMGRSRIYGS